MSDFLAEIELQRTNIRTVLNHLQEKIKNIEMRLEKKEDDDKALRNLEAKRLKIQRQIKAAVMKLNHLDDELAIMNRLWEEISDDEEELYVNRLYEDRTTIPRGFYHYVLLLILIPILAIVLHIFLN